MNNHAFRIGGAPTPLPEGFKEKLTKWLDEFPDALKDFQNVLNGNEIFLARTKNVGVIDAEMCKNYGVYGANLRAAGVKIDLRGTSLTASTTVSISKCQLVRPATATTATCCAIGNGRICQDHPPGSGANARRRSNHGQVPKMIKVTGSVLCTARRRYGLPWRFRRQ